MTIYELGETTIVARIIRRLDIEFEDCAILDLSETEYLVATTDMFHRETDFPHEMSAWQIGWMCAAGTLSDIAAMGARPSGLLVSMGIPDLNPAFVDSVVDGMDACARRCGTRVIGGDTDSHQELTICGTGLGHVPKNQILRRKGANVGDIVCVTGNLGMAGLGMAELEQKLEPGGSAAIKKLFEPIPRVEEGITLAESGAVTAMMDNSDGLSLSLHQLADINCCGFEIMASALPVPPEPWAGAGVAPGSGLEHESASVSASALELALYAGGDFELLATVTPDRLGDAARVCELTVIGRVIDDGVFLKDCDGGAERIERKGYRSL